MNVIERAIDAANIALPIVALYSAILSYNQIKQARSFRALGRLFIAIFLMTSLEVTASAFPASGWLSQSVEIFDFTIMFWVFPLFHAYIHELTADTSSNDRLTLVHYLVPVLALIFVVILSFFEVEYTKGSGEIVALASRFRTSLEITAILITVGLYAQWLVYIILMFRRLNKYRSRLCDVFSNTEGREMRWVSYLFGLMFLYATFSLVDDSMGGLTGAHPVSLLIDKLMGLGIIVFLGMWSLRQQPGLVCAQHPAHSIPTRPAPEGTIEKYQKSSLSIDDQLRIARKLKKALENDYLQRDPDLSLWTLSRHIGAAPNYVSQTLNDYMKLSFFDFVNNQRIEDAKVLLNSSALPVTSIAYDVGFNSRSAFYSAFKRQTGQTPTNYRMLSD